MKPYITPFNRSFFAFAVLSIFILVVSKTAYSASLSQVSASANYLFLKHANYNANGITTNAEKGWLPGVQFSISNRKKYLKGTFTIEAFIGDAEFDQELADGMLHSQTREQLNRFSYRLDYNQPRKFYQFYAMGTFNNWKRDTRTQDSISVPGRQYQWWRLDAGVQIEMYDSPRNTLQADFAISHDLLSEMLLDLTQENLGKPLLKLDNKVGGSINIVFKHRFSRDHSGEFFAKTNYWQFGSSNTRKISNSTQTYIVKEGESQSLTSSIGAAYVYHF